jgi:hypothetical protein
MRLYVGKKFMILSGHENLGFELPKSGHWEFGGHLYGLEPLALPARWAERDPGPGVQDWVSSAPWPGPDAVPDIMPASDSEVDRLVWFRWIVGHQTTFILWQLLAAVLDEAGRPGADQDELASAARSLVCGYSLMLLYAASSPEERYDRVIRDPMARQHPNLSGAWARDYTEIRPLIRGKAALGGPVEAAALADECALNEQVHQGIATRLVPSGVSLLLNRDVRKGVRPIQRDTLLWLYDGIFLTTRAEVAYDAQARQLLRRLHAIHLDISANGLYPACYPPQQEPAELLTGEAMELKASFPSTLRRIAELAAAS